MFRAMNSVKFVEKKSPRRCGVREGLWFYIGDRRGTVWARPSGGCGSHHAERQCCRGHLLFEE